VDRTPRGYEARIAAEAGTATARKADHEREAIAGRIPHLDVLDGSDDAAELHGAPSGYMLGLTHYSGFPVHRSSRRGYSSLFHGQIMRVFRRPRSHDGRRNLGSILEPPPIVPDRQMAAIVLSHVSVPQPSIDLTPIGESLQRGSDAYGQPDLL